MRRVLVLFALVCVVAGCGSGDSEPPPDELTGVVVAIDGEGSDVSAFTLEVDGEEHEIRIADGVDYGFDLAHLQEHLRDALPVRCEIDERDGDLYALTIEDA